MPRLTGETIYLVRHGETHWNVEGRIQGQLDSELTERGVEQARAFGRLLRTHVGPDDTFVIESSPTGRALATACIVADALGIDHATIRTTPLLAERHMGQWAGLRLDEVDRAFPSANARRTIDDPAHVPVDGEGFEDLLRRAGTWLEMERAAPVTIAVTHGLIGRAIRGAYLAERPELAFLGQHPQDRIFRMRDGAIAELLASGEPSRDRISRPGEAG
jgi:probable phosphoglycerate mutase